MTTPREPATTPEFAGRLAGIRPRPGLPGHRDPAHAAGNLPAPQNPSPDAVIAHLQGKQVPYTTWEGWYRLDAHEKSLGAPQGRERVKVVEREDMLKASL